MDILEVKQNLNKTVYYSDFYNIPEPTPFILNACIARKDPRGFLKYSLELLDKTTVARSDSEKVQTSNVNTSENKFVSYAAYSELIDKRIDRLYEIKKEILENVNKLDDATLRTILILRYLNFQTWEMIACKMNYGYRHILRLHGNALIEIKNVIECHIEPVI